MFFSIIKYFFIILFNKQIYLISSSAVKDRCLQLNGDLSSSNLLDFTFNKVGPRAKQKAGSFFEQPGNSSIISCAEACCKHINCNVAWIKTEKCYLIECNKTLANGCDPVESSQPGYQKNVMIVMRPPQIYHNISTSTTFNVMPTNNTKYQAKTLAFTTVNHHHRASQSSSIKQSASQHHVIVTLATPQLPPWNVSLEYQKTVQLPVDQIRLVARVHPQVEGLSFMWTFVSPSLKSLEKINVAGQATNDFSIKNALAGNYVVRLEVGTRSAQIRLNASFTVLPVKRQNSPPVARIVPTNQVLQLPNNLVIDGSSSTDDDRIVAWKWYAVSGPLLTIPDDREGTSSILQLQNLLPGQYQFKLTVVDSDGVSASTQANVTVLQAKDLPPVARAGQNMVVFLPQNSVKLFGNASTDDNQIAHYEWTKIAPPELTADMQGVRSPVLTVSNLEKGVYTFRLRVTDLSGLNSTADVQVFVKPRQSVPPRAVTAGEVTVTLPRSEIRLDAGQSSAINGLARFNWSLVKGGPDGRITDADRSVAVFKDFHLGDYEFLLTVWDKEGLSSSAKLLVHVKEVDNLPPKARPGLDQELSETDIVARIDGSKSWDDQEIVSYFWTRSKNSPAAGNVLNESDKQPVLLLANLRKGVYTFNLTVTDKFGLADSGLVVLNVLPRKDLKSLVEIYLNLDFFNFTELQKIRLEAIIENMLNVNNLEHKYKFRVVSINEELGSQGVILLAHAFKAENIAEFMDADLLASKIVSKLKSSNEFPLTNARPYVCLNSCGGHGLCDNRTKKCICNAYWISNPIRLRFGDKQSNCDWSIIYLVLGTIVGLVIFAFLIWLIICLLRRSSSNKYRVFDLNSQHLHTRPKKLSKRSTREMSKTNGHIKYRKLPNSSDPDFLNDKKGQLNQSHFSMQRHLQNCTDTSESLSSDEEDTIYQPQKRSASIKMSKMAAVTSNQT